MLNVFCQIQLNRQDNNLAQLKQLLKHKTLNTSVLTELKCWAGGTVAPLQ